MLLGRGSQPAVTCKRSWDSSGGNRWDFMLGCPVTSAVVHSCMVDLGRCLQSHLADGACFNCQRWTCKVTQPIQLTPLWPVAWLSAVDKSRVLSPVRYGWCMWLCLMFFGLMMLCVGRMSLKPGWRGLELRRPPVPSGGFMCGRGGARFRVVRLGGPQVR